MFQVRVLGVDDLRFETANQDDAETIASLIVAFGIKITSKYKRDENGDIIDDARGFGIKEITEERAEVAIKAIEPEPYADDEEVTI